jgi:hypothetical protein
MKGQTKVKRDALLLFIGEIVMFRPGIELEARKEVMNEEGLGRDLHLNILRGTLGSTQNMLAREISPPMGDLGIPIVLLAALRYVSRRSIFATPIYLLDANMIQALLTEDL